MPVIRDVAGRLLTEVRCRGCGYVLRGMRPADDCPECGRAVADSLRSDLLQFADRRWLRGLSAGAALLLVYLLAQFAFAGRDLWMGFVSPTINTNRILLWVELPALAAALFRLVAVWRLTRSSPEHGIGIRPTPMAHLAWVCAVVTVGTLALQVVNFYPPVHEYLVNLPGGELAFLVFSLVNSSGFRLVVQVLWCVGVFALLAVIARLARRVPDAPLARLAGRIKWASVAMGGCAVVLALAEIVFRPSPSFSLSSTSSPAGVVVAWGYVGLWLAGLGLAGAVVVLMVRFRRAIAGALAAGDGEPGAVAERG